MGRSSLLRFFFSVFAGSVFPVRGVSGIVFAGCAFAGAGFPLETVFSFFSGLVTSGTAIPRYSSSMVWVRSFARRAMAFFNAWIPLGGKACSRGRSQRRVSSSTRSTAAGGTVPVNA